MNLILVGPVHLFVMRESRAFARKTHVEWSPSLSLAWERSPDRE